MQTAFILLSLVANAFGYLVTRPSLTQGWTNHGAQTLAWDRVSTDATNFTVVLTNINRDLLPRDIVLSSFVDATSATTVSIEEPSGGWPTAGGSYRVNFVRSANELNTIYAQSSEFNITATASTGTTSARTSSATTSKTTGTAAAASTGNANSGTSGSSTGTQSGNTTTDEDMTAPTNSASSLRIGAPILAVASVFGYLLL